MNTKTQTLKDIIRNPYAWPGGYEIFALTTDGGSLCHNCLRDNYYNILHSTRGNYNDGWDVVAPFAVGINCDNATCDHCNYTAE